MDYSEAEKYAEAMMFARRAISDGVKSARAQQKAQRNDFFGHFMQGKDPTADTAIRESLPLPVIRCFYNGQAFLVNYPERWLKVMQQALDLYRQRFGDAAYLTINHRFIWGWEVQRLIKAENISKRNYQSRRTEFLHGLVLLAAQAGLIYITAKEGNKQ